MHKLAPRCEMVSCALLHVMGDAKERIVEVQDEIQSLQGGLK